MDSPPPGPDSAPDIDDIDGALFVARSYRTGLTAIPAQNADPGSSACAGCRAVEARHFASDVPTSSPTEDGVRTLH